MDGWMKAFLVRWMKAQTYRWMNKWMNPPVKISNGWNVWINRLMAKLSLNGWIGVWVNE